jgi:hypothetical protein
MKHTYIHPHAEAFMIAASRPAGSTVTPLLFGKRKPVAPTVATQYSGTDTELDIKGTSETA